MGLHASYNSRLVLKDITFDVSEGEFVGIIGPNGSGKTTLLRVMTGILPPASGTVTLRGEYVPKIPSREFARVVAVVPQNPTVAFDFTVLEVVLMGRSPHLGRFQTEGESDLAIAESALRRTNLIDLADRKTAELSGGERQRLMVARALAQGTEAILLDEPTAHLDINYQVEILHLLKRENIERKKTIIVILHDLNLAAEFCDRLIMLRDGAVHVDGTPEEVITPANIQLVYGTAVWVRRHPTSGRPYVLSVGSRAVASRLSGDSGESGGTRVHVVCGGGSGRSIFTALIEAGYEVTAGVINIGDTDQEAAESLGIEYVEETPFSPISDIAEEANLRFIAQADVLVVAEAPFGTGNIANLRCAEKAFEMGKPVCLIGSKAEFGRRDFTGGHAARILERLAESGAMLVESPADLAAWIAKITRQ